MSTTLPTSGDGVGTASADPIPEAPRKEILFKRRISVLGAFRELWQFRELVFTLAERDLRVRYKQAVLGIGWAFLTPLLLLGVFNLIFKRVTDVSAHGAPYPLFAAIGLIVWSFFSTAFARGGTSLVSNIALLNKLYLPREVFPLSSIALAAVDGFAATIVVGVLFIVYGYAPQPETYWAPLMMVIVVCFSMGVTMAVSAVVVYLRDLQVVLPMIIQFGLFVTPVAYSAKTVVHGQTGETIFAALNPLSPAIDGLRRGILEGQAPLLWPTVVGAISSLIVLVGGFLMFKRLEAGIADVA